MRYLVFVAGLMAMLGLEAKNEVEERLAPYKPFLEKGTFEGVTLPASIEKPLSRYETFKRAFEECAAPGKIIVELGSSYRFTNNLSTAANPQAWDPARPERWDWASGLFTRMAAHALYPYRPQIHTVDHSAKHLERCKYLTEEYQDCIEYHNCTSEQFLASCCYPNGIDLLYVDTGAELDTWKAAVLQLRELQIVIARDLIHKGGLVLINDARKPPAGTVGEPSTISRTMYSVPFLISEGFEILADGYQILLRKL